MAEGNMHIYIPTYDRVDKQLTLQNLPPRWRKRCTLVVRPEERKAFVARGIDNLLVLPQRIKRIAAVRQYVADTTPHRFVMMMDDDLSFQSRRKWNEAKQYWHLGPATSGEVTDALNKINRVLRTIHPVVGISARNLNSRVRAEWAVNTRVMHAFAFDTVAVRAAGAQFIPVEVMEDFYFVLGMLTAGYTNAVLHDMCVSPAPTNAAGGCSSWRTHAIQAESARTLAARFPRYVRLRQKNVKGGLGEQIDVTIQWKKAHSESKKRA